MEIKSRFFQSPGTSFFLFGPRGTGKTTWLRENYPAALTLDLLSPEAFRQYSAMPERLTDLIEGNPDRSIVIIDEVQKVPALLDVVHQLIEKKKNVTFILTGSSSRKLKRTGIDLLAGRALKKTMHPFMAAELGSSFDFNQAVKFGLLPLVLASPHCEDVLRSYVSLYIREEVMMEGLVRNVGNFSRFIEAISFSHGCVLNLSEVARECQVGRKTVESFISILEDLYLAFRVPVFTRRAKRKIVVHPKFYFFDTGVFRSVRPSGPIDSPDEIGGAAVEGLVAQHLHAWNAYSGEKNDLFYWRTKGGNEVDFVLYGRDMFCAIEVKNSKSFRPGDLRGLSAFKSDYPEAQALLLYRGKEKLRVNDILVCPCEDFLKNLKPDEFFLENI